jgi:SNF2 family DNA or RNA helicase
MNENRRGSGHKATGQAYSRPKHTKQITKQFNLEGALTRLEFHRDALALLPEINDKRPGIAFLVIKDGNDQVARSCTCAVSKKSTCSHILELVETYKALNKRLKGKTLYDDFKSTIWQSFAELLSDFNQESLEKIRVKKLANKNGAITTISDPRKGELLRYLSNGPGLQRLLDRCVSTIDEGDELTPNRAAVLASLRAHTTTEAEWLMRQRGFKTRREALEEGFWYRVAYHGYREFGAEGCTFQPNIDKKSGAFAVTCCDLSGSAVFRLIIPRNAVKRLILSLEKHLPNQHNMPIHPVPLKSIFNISATTELDLEIRPLVTLLQEDGEKKFFEREDLERFRYDDLIYLPELGIMTELERPESKRRFAAPIKMVLKKSQVPEFLDDFGEELFNEANIISPDVKSLKVLTRYDRVEVRPQDMDRDWYWLSVKYGFGNNLISLKDILQAKKEGQRYIGSDEGWIDVLSPDLEGISGFFQGKELREESDGIRLSRMDILRLRISNKIPIEISGGDGIGDSLKNLLDMKASRPFPKLRCMKSALRAYQELGAEWIMFLFENGFGGLLCDDMGLGKTHQVMAFMVALREALMVKGPLLVVCPTTVLHHWSGKIKNHAPSLKATIYHGGDRDLKKAANHGDVLITSYGVLTRDVDELKKYTFPLAVFDEIQHIKNPETKAYKAAEDLDATMKLGLTGTPIENSLKELKSLLDLAVPGYMGRDEYFDKRYVQPIQLNHDASRQEELSRVISPFTLRRLKKSVLDELPEKIEDVMSCDLSDDQVKLYRDAVSSRGKGLLKMLKNNDEPVPYIHIFALLNMLKQICNHPALLENDAENFEKYQSGKWDLFAELLEEIMDSGQKVVVYSQYLGMIEIIEKFLRRSGVGFATLTGASRKRGEIVERFNTDPDCHVFVGSLKAGGVGIDLVAASVVIHYDRWWNAAKEDQATDRVHRIGQKRGVHVFKLITSGTLEEKISAIIARKKNLMDSIVKEDDAGLLKTFSREDLIELLDYQPQPDKTKQGATLYK